MQRAGDGSAQIATGTRGKAALPIRHKNGTRVAGYNHGTNASRSNFALPQIRMVESMITLVKAIKDTMDSPAFGVKRIGLWVLNPWPRRPT